MPTDLLVPRPILVVIGPSASGKSSVVRELARREILPRAPHLDDAAAGAPTSTTARSNTTS